MTIDEAIRILKTMWDIEGEPFTPLGKEALTLGIEALKRLKNLRKLFLPGTLEKLPGETGE